MPAANDVKEIKLSYFDFPGRVEPIRFALAISKFPFTENRIAMSEFGKMRETLSFRSLPVIELDGRMYSQTGGLLRYIGKAAGLVPSDAEEALQADEVVDVMSDLFSAFWRYFGNDKERLHTERMKVLEADIPRYLGGIEARIAFNNPSGSPFAVGDKLSIADLAIASNVMQLKASMYEPIPTTCTDKYPRVMASYNEVMKLAEVKEYLTKYPVPGLSQ